MNRTQSKKSGLIRVNGTEIYHEVKGSGPSVLFVAGALSAGAFDRIADELADEFTVVTYDRRGNSRSPKPEGWTSTSMGEQADDAAGLAKTLGLSPAIVFGTSGGGGAALDLVLRHPDVVQSAIIHEPVILNILGDQAQELLSPLRSLIEESMAKGGYPAAVEAFVRVNAGDATFEAIEPKVRERILRDGETFFDIEFAAMSGYRPTESDIGAASRPIQVLLSTETSVPFAEPVCRWLAALVKSEVATLSGGHAPYFDRPEIMAGELRPFLRKAAFA